MNRTLVCALALAGVVGSAQAADLGLDGMKDPLPDTLTFKGVTIYGTIDVGYAYQSNGAPFSGAMYTGLDYNMYGSKQNRQVISTLTNNALSQSQVGVKFEESLGMGFVAIGKLDTGFNPASGEIGDECASIIRNNGKPFTQASSSGDGSRCGQAFNGQAYAGLSNAAYGTLTIGRQNSLDLDLMNNYDPMGMSYSMSLIGWSGGAGPGIGMTETARWDNSLKYIYQYGPAHAAFMFASGSGDDSLQGNSYAGNIGVTWKGFSIDAVYTKEVDGVYATAPYSYTATGTTVATATCVSGSSAPATYSGSTQLTNPGCNTLSVTGADSEAWTVAGKYVFDFGGGYKDLPSSKLTLFAGYQHAELSNPDNPLNLGSTTIGGYIIGLVSNTYYTTHRVNQTEWGGLKYELDAWAFTGAYYHLDQNSYVLSGTACTHGGSTAKNCSGDTNTASFLVDYTFTKHFDIYSGVSWSEVDGGLVNGYIGAHDNTTWVSGLRLKF
jgi:predicted porin